MNINQVQDARVKQLAQTLKNNGLAASDTQAIQMAENMTQTETKVIKQASDNKSSMVRNYDVNKGDSPRTPTQPSPAPAQQEQPSQPSWEQEVTAQEHPAPQGPVPTFKNQALNDAITNVQQQFEQPASQDTFSSMSVAQAAEESTPASVPATEEPAATEAPASIVENPLPATTTEAPIETQPQASYQAPAAPAPEPMIAAPTPSEAPNSPTNRPATEEPAEAPMASAPVEEDQPEQTQEVTTPLEQRPEKDLSKFEESRVSLADVFNFNK